MPARSSSATRHMAGSFAVTLSAQLALATTLLETTTSSTKLAGANICLCLCCPCQNLYFPLHVLWRGVKALLRSAEAQQTWGLSSCSTRGGIRLAPQCLGTKRSQWAQQGLPKIFSQSFQTGNVRHVIRPLLLRALPRIQSSGV